MNTSDDRNLNLLRPVAWLTVFLLLGTVGSCLPDSDEAPTFYPGVVPGKPFAPVVIVSEGHPDREGLQALLESLEVPDQARVGLPPYPGARVSTMTFYPHSDLERIDLLTPDSPQEVLEFYRERLHDWTVAEASSKHFVMLPPTEPNLEKAFLYEVPSVQIQSASKEFGDLELMPEAKVSIWITYRPLD